MSSWPKRNSNNKIENISQSKIKVKQDSELLTLLKAQFICCTTLNVCHVINHCFHNNISFLNLKYKTMNTMCLLN